VGKPDGNIPLGRLRHKWVDNVKMGVEGIGWGGVDWTVSQDRVQWRALVNVVMNWWSLE
jgi:hypothetical protein